MKKILVLFVLFTAVPKCNAEARAEVKSIAISSNYDGSQVDITIKDSKENLTEIFSLDPTGQIRLLDISYLENRNQAIFHIFFREGRAESIHYIYREADSNEQRYMSYTINRKTENLFDLVDKIVEESARKYDFSVLAKQESRRKRAQYLKEEEKKRKREEAEQKRIPAPLPTLQKIQKM